MASSRTDGRAPYSLCQVRGLRTHDALALVSAPEAAVALVAPRTPRLKPRSRWRDLCAHRRQHLVPRVEPRLCHAQPVVQVLPLGVLWKPAVPEDVQKRRWSTRREARAKVSNLVAELRRQVPQKLPALPRHRLLELSESLIEKRLED